MQAFILDHAICHKPDQDLKLEQFENQNVDFYFANRGCHFECLINSL